MGVIFKSFEWDLYRVKFFIYNVKDDGVENESSFYFYMIELILVTYFRTIVIFIDMGPLEE